MGQTHMLTYGIMRSNAQIVERIARISRDLGREVVSTDETQNILGLPGRK